MNEQDEKDYQNGYNSRAKGNLKNACPFKIHEDNVGKTRWRRRCAWIGGWAEKDNEFGTKGENYE